MVYVTQAALHSPARWSGLSWQREGGHPDPGRHGGSVSLLSCVFTWLTRREETPFPFVTFAIKSALIPGFALPLSPVLNGIILAWQVS